jgi:hypothetical protein
MLEQEFESIEFHDIGEEFIGESASEMECCICARQGVTEAGLFKCGHRFCSPCVKQWFSHGHCSCPICRQESPMVKLLYRGFPTGEEISAPLGKGEIDGSDGSDGSDDSEGGEGAPAANPLAAEEGISPDVLQTVFQRAEKIAERYALPDVVKQQIISSALDLVVRRGIRTADQAQCSVAEAVTMLGDSPC